MKTAIHHISALSLTKFRLPTHSSQGPCDFMLSHGGILWSFCLCCSSMPKDVICHGSTRRTFQGFEVSGHIFQIRDKKNKIKNEEMLVNPQITLFKFSWEVILSIFKASSFLLDVTFPFSHEHESRIKEVELQTGTICFQNSLNFSSDSWVEPAYSSGSPRGGEENTTATTDPGTGVCVGSRPTAHKMSIFAVAKQRVIPSYFLPACMLAAPEIRNQNIKGFLFLKYIELWPKTQFPLVAPPCLQLYSFSS